MGCLAKWRKSVGTFVSTNELDKIIMSFRYHELFELFLYCSPQNIGRSLTFFE